MAEVRGGLSGDDWEYTLFYYDKNHPRSPRKYKDADLLTLKKSIEDGEITEVDTFKNPLFVGQKTDYLIYHMFIIFKSDKWWWSIEKLMKGIILQQGKNKSQVRDIREGSPRQPKPISQINEGKGQHTVSELIGWLHDGKELDRKYNIVFDNCKHFGSRAFKFLTGNDASEIFSKACAPPVQYKQVKTD